MAFSRLALGATLIVGACTPDPMSLVGDDAADMGSSTSSAPSGVPSTGSDPASSSGDAPETGGGSSSSSGSSSSIGGPMGEQCYPEALHGEQLTRTASGWTLYEGCEADDFVLQPDAEPDLPVGEFASLELLGAPGIYGTGTGLCCNDDEICDKIYLHRWDATVDDVLAYFDETYADFETGCLGLHIEVTGLTKPRCTSEDPDCLPTACIEGEVYDPALSRVPADYGIQEGSCSHDGDCIGSGIHCRSWQERQDGVALECGLEGSFCGCVERECRFFTQE